MKRRSFVDIFLGGSLIGAVAALLYPILRYIWPPRQSGAKVDRVTAGRVGELAPNTARIFRFGTAPAILVFTGQGEYKALTAVCTHLACTIRYDPDSETLFCPCHNGRFDLGGRVLSGPPPLPLETYRVDVVGTEIIVSVRG
jgi:cytochrome b6-f complex iron-sulfur subunit